MNQSPQLFFKPSENSSHHKGWIIVGIHPLVVFLAVHVVPACWWRLRLAPVAHEPHIWNGEPQRFIISAPFASYISHAWGVSLLVCNVLDA
ncbi:hypothetical protein CC85DRAFT_52890 [Cutaneotrichosporon oleaginosum]|uniref:Uncharacterized protein n=1 Tax=Cutaneotrichosporon oleaginosum TaxID=879819 RepID=A0A0J0XQT1_9TREE|nr:uncharacterized protein CC85DRAFT_52890 [Cutaneotrichosporon oleaginosum]KLT43443.1 hypothetical protein CC85DRAFT_52890 [Cutaneotrichosporon oleaginosum]TXT05344.1 hypothetical protein COLE_06664 [Cutaneotrichosporon oleaginosum]